MDTRGLMEKIKKKQAYMASGAAFMIISGILLNQYLKGKIQLKSFQSFFMLNKLYKNHAFQSTQTDHKLITDKSINYPTWQRILKNKKLPAAIVNLDAFDHNVDKLAELVSKSGKTLRIATKSIRVPDLILRALTKHPEIFKGVMCYTAEEAAFLHTLGVDDILIAYPTVQQSDLNILRELHASGAKVSLVVDSVDQMKLISEAMQELKTPFPVVIEMDMSLRPMRDLVHLGVRRSPVRTTDDLRTILKAAHDYSNLQVIGVMAYEAAVAGLTDNNPHKKMLNPVANLVRKMVASHAAKLRAEIPKIFEEIGIPLKIFNGGGTGSVNYAVNEKDLTEVTVGSGLLCSHLFDYYSNLKDTFYFEPSIYFALQTTRTSDPGYITCLGGGYIASGEPGWDRVPKPVMPEGLKLTSSEACGEVNTPMAVTGAITPPLGGPTLFRPAKAGELAERFNEYLLVSDEQVTGQAKTYRGMGKCFL
jgi:D-serine deaminase-like pyridoxal phosphate-dependent protein